MFRRLLRNLRVLFAGLIVLVLGVGWFVLCTVDGSRMLTGQILAHAAEARGLTIRWIGGTLWDGLVLRDIDVGDLKALPQGSHLHLQGVDITPLSRWAHWPQLNTLRQLRAVGHAAQLKVPQPSLLVSVNMIEAGLSTDWALQDVAIEGLQGLPQNAPITTQRVVVGLPIGLRRIRSLHNGKIPLQYSEPVIVSGHQDDGQLDVQLYSKTIDVPEILELIGMHHLRDVLGTLADVHLHVTGQSRRPSLSGEFLIVKLVQKSFAMIDCPGNLSLQLHRIGRTDNGGLKIEVDGSVLVRAGSLATKNATIRLEPSRLVFAGDLAEPSFDLKGVSKIEGTTIHMTLKGTKDRPELKLTSEPPQPQDRLLLMLATGKGWKGANLLLTEGQIPVDLVKDFVDFAFFGGRGTKLARRLGISDISLTYDPGHRGVGVGTVFFNRVEAGYEVEQPPPDRPGDKTQPSMTHKVGAGYKLSNDSSIAIEGEKTVESRTHTTDPAEKTPPAKLEEDLFDKILLKYNKKF